MKNDAFVKGEDHITDDGDESPNEFEMMRLKQIHFSTTVDDYDSTAKERFTNLDNLNKIVTRLMKKQNHSAETQTDQAMFEDEDAATPDPKKQAMKQLMSGKPATAQDPRTATPASEYIESVQLGANEPIENQVAQFHLPLNMQGKLNEDLMFEYHMRLNQLLNTHKKSKKDGNFSDMGKYVWSTSNVLLMFLEPMIRKYTDRPVFTSDDKRNPLRFEKATENWKPKLYTWVQVKTLIWDIYEHRLVHAGEINGTVNNTYCSLDEHLLVFMFDKYKNRPDTERGLVEFLSSLKYYAESW